MGWVYFFLEGGIRLANFSLYAFLRILLVFFLKD